MLRSLVKQSGESMVPKKKKKVTLGRIWRKEGFKPRMKEWGGDEWWEGESMEPMEEVPLTRLGESEVEKAADALSV